MSPPTPTPDETHASAEPRELARPEAAIARASRRLRMITDLGDMAMILARAVHERALAEEAAAKAALAVRETVAAEPEEEPPAPSETIPARSKPTKPARSGEQTRRAAPRVRAGSHTAGPAPVMNAGALFARLSDIVNQCLELEIRIDEELRRLEAALSVTRERVATLRERLDEDKTYRDVASRPDTVGAASLRRDLGLQPNAFRPNAYRSPHPPPDP